ncbi:LuxR C-terminal-related transcriptional regulator [Halocynthiibacter sp. C4]|uniref:helix-turn-helix transcriptional regulator n=1 Tax=Halocynthiibacter sp. C4 TaxID=2992758 RepID=UPI00237A12F9|nr:LuxR C-terminal-related transcriptional regulator [Halocynthiibacter sp. C4]MDE0589529.1 LuxR C-terminal-related transcriptional regulator [Halocynthiibacter sp. C4]
MSNTVSAPEGRVLTDVDMIGAIAHWCECLQGRNDLNSALKLLAESLNAKAVALARVSRDGSSPTKSVLYDSPDSKSTRHPLTRSYARALIGDYLLRTKVGAIWFKTLIDTESENALTEFHRNRGLNEMVVIPLEVHGKTIDVLEVHFAHRLDAGLHAILNILTPTFTETWKNRAPGLVTRSMLHRVTQKEPVGQGGLPIMSLENPAHLSRAEYRVCLLLCKGLSNGRICNELSICDSTLRTHLRNIYLKANMSSQAELTHNLLTMQAMPEPQHLEKRA